MKPRTVEAFTCTEENLYEAREKCPANIGDWIVKYDGGQYVSFTDKDFRNIYIVDDEDSKRKPTKDELDDILLNLWYAQYWQELLEKEKTENATDWIEKQMIGFLEQALKICHRVYKYGPIQNYRGISIPESLIEQLKLRSPSFHLPGS